ncbi:MAG TPA: hypothetical protein VFS28_03420, partial [Gemmatimonadales bacterium]|nr:hypothetical protein [Gemmatimonadales bacterium]
MAQSRDPPNGPADAWLVPVLVRAGLLDEARGEELAHLDGPVWEECVARGWATDDQVAAAVAAHFRVPRADLARAEERYRSLLPEPVARAYRVLRLA